MMVPSRALFFDGPRQIAIRDVMLPPPSAGEVLVRGIASSISQGTEMLLYRGEGPEPFDPSLASSSSSSSSSSASGSESESGSGSASTSKTTYPRRYGYAWVGQREDERIFALAPHGDAHVLAREAARPIRSDIPSARATLAANIETAITCVWDAGGAFGERVVVLGAGLVGILVAWLLVRSGQKVTIVDPRGARCRCARELVPSVEVAANECMPDGSADLIVEATGDPRALDDAIAWAAPSARIVVTSFYGRRRAPNLDLGDAFHRRRLSLVASQVSSIPPSLTPRWNADRRFDLVQDLLGEPKLDALIAPSVPFEQAAELYERIDRAADSFPCHVLTY